jgi:hypothetical protein
MEARLESPGLLVQIGILLWSAIGVAATIAAAIGFTIFVVWIITLL